MPGSEQRPERAQTSGPRRSAAAGGGSAAGRGASAGGGRRSGAAATGGAPRGGGPRRQATPEEIAKRTYDPRREERRKAIRVPLPEGVDPRMLDAEARRELRTLSKDTADLVAQHLVVTGQLLDDDPEQALAHARAARALAGRVAVVREAAGLAAYAVGEWAEALTELRTARRISGRPAHLGVMADCERALGRPERALAYGNDPQLAQLSQEERVELVIVLAGARRDMGQREAAVVALQDPARRTTDKRPWAARLWYAYADALLAAGREGDAREWFAKAAAVDADGQTDAGDRLLALDGVVVEEEDLEDRDDLPSEAELAELVRDVRPLHAPVFSAPDDGVAVPAHSPDEGSPSRAGASTSDSAPLPPSGVAPPPFAAPADVADGRDTAPTDGPAGDLRLFD